MTSTRWPTGCWRVACGVWRRYRVAGVHGRVLDPVYEVLKQRGLTVWLVDARQMRYVPGRKSDVQDCQWLQKLMSLGFLRAAFRPDGEVCVVRAVARQRDVLLADQASWVQRMQKALVQMNIQIRVSSDSKNSNASAALPRSTAVPLRLASRSTQTRFQRKTGDQPVLFLMSTPRPTTSVVRPPRGKENSGTALRFLESRLIEDVEPFHGCPQHTEAGHCFRI